MYPPFIDKSALITMSFYGVNCNLVDLTVVPHYLTPYFIFILFAATTFALISKKWYNTLYFAFSLIYVFCGLFLYIEHATYLKVIVAFPLGLVFIYLACYSFSTYGFAWDFFSRLWEGQKLDFALYDKEQNLSTVSEILLNRPKWKPIIMCEKRSFFEKLIDTWLCFYTTCVLAFVVVSNLFFTIRGLLKLVLLVVSFSGYILSVIADIDNFPEVVTLWDTIILKSSAYYSLSVLVLGVLLFIIVTVLILCFDKENWVKNFERFYGVNVLSKLGYNNPYKSGATKLFILGGTSGIFSFSFFSPSSSECMAERDKTEFKIGGSFNSSISPIQGHAEITHTHHHDKDGDSTIHSANSSFADLRRQPSSGPAPAPAASSPATALIGMIGDCHKQNDRIYDQTNSNFGLQPSERAAATAEHERRGDRCNNMATPGLLRTISKQGAEEAERQAKR